MTTVYENSAFADVDIGASMRSGHPDVAAGDRWIVDRVRAFVARRDGVQHILDVGSGSGVLTELLAQALPEHRVVANDVVPGEVERARARLASHLNAEVFDRPFQDWLEPVDVVVSWGSHHHLPHDYLRHVRNVLSPGGRLIIGDEFCPEYLPAEVRDSLDRGEQVAIEDGYILVGSDIDEYARSGAVPELAKRLESRRRQALWRWYRYVVDYAIERDAWDVAILELQIMRDDLITGFAGEHKTSPLLLEHELGRGGFRCLDRWELTPRPAHLSSFVLFELDVRDDGDGR
jgi:SAM-dependent methyltransferase